MQTFAEVIGLWPSATKLAADIGEKEGTVRQWRNRDRIPSEVWQAVAAAAKRRGFTAVTINVLARIAAAKRAA